jgi:excinuclease ABC subunit C
MVVFVNGKPAKEEYRQFRIKSFPSSDDPKMLAETLARRFMHPEWEFPDLIMIDGGEPQLRGIFKYFKKLPVNLPKMVGLVKGEETIVVPEDNGYKSLSLPKSDPFLKTLMALRDEAHRFARRYHHKLHLKSLLNQ